MKLELHDSSEEGDTLVAAIKYIDYDYQAEQWVQNTHADHPEIVKWILFDDQGVRCVWECPQGSQEMPTITQRSDRFSGQWEKSPSEVAI